MQVRLFITKILGRADVISLTGSGPNCCFTSGCCGYLTGHFFDPIYYCIESFKICFKYESEIFECIPRPLNYEDAENDILFATVLPRGVGNDKIFFSKKPNYPSTKFQYRPLLHHGMLI